MRNAFYPLLMAPVRLPPAVHKSTKTMPSFLARILGLGPVGPETLLSQDQFRSVLERERMRADRMGNSLSLLVITPPARPQRRRHIQRLAQILSSRLRATDVAGRLGRCQVGALLPNTTADAAWRVAEEVRDTFDSGDTQLKCDVLSHPFPSDVNPGDPGSREAETGSGGQPIEPLHHVFLKPLPWWKRGLDIIGASVGLVLLSPLLAAAAIGIKLTSPGAIFFTQLRAGLGGQPFKIYKFRTMCLDAESQKDSLRTQNEQDGPAFKIKNDPRVTTLGRYMRVTCVDELPQLWNVLKGDMTLVGPRPLPVEEAEKCQNWEQRRLDVTPGLTCIRQAAGRRKRISFADWMRMDLRYIKGRSLRRDVALLWRTFVNVIFHRASH